MTAALLSSVRATFAAPRPAAGGSALWPVWSVAGFYIVTTLLLQHDWLASGGIWAEGATNYFPNARSPDILVRLFSTDAGYIPLPQRLIAQIGVLLGLSASATAYFYSAAALLFGGLCVASIAHKLFRPLIADDRLRLVLAILLAITPNFDTRQFINFTYLGLIPTTAVAALAWTGRGHDAPWWVWCVPLLMLSKPAQLAVVPAMAAGSLLACPKLRRLLWIGIAVAIMQLVRLAISAATETIARSVAKVGLGEKIVNAIEHGAGFLTLYAAGPQPADLLLRLPILLSVAAGFAIAVFALWLAVRRGGGTGALLIVSLSVVFAYAVLICFVATDRWGHGLGKLLGYDTGRDCSAIVIGSFFILFALADTLLGKRRLPLPGGRSLPAAVAVAIGWVVLSGWPIMALRAAPGTMYDFGGHYWQHMADRIDAPGGILCIPVAPYGHAEPDAILAYKRGCRQLNDGVTFEGPTIAVGAPGIVAVPRAASLSPVAALFVVRRTPSRSVVRAEGHGISGRVLRFEGAAPPASSGLILLEAAKGQAPEPLADLRIGATPPIDLVAGGDGRPALIYYGAAQP